MARTILTKNQIANVDFDPLDPEHLHAFETLCLQPISVQHPTLRFNVDEPHDSVPIMMLHKIAQAHLDRITPETQGLAAGFEAMHYIQGGVADL